MNIDIIAIITQVTGWLVIGLLAYRIYKKQEHKPKLWKIIIIVYIGLFSFSFNWNMFDTLIKIAVLPLGVWILYFFLKVKEGRWQKYRQYAWIGFIGNYIFLAVILFSIPLHHVLYPQDKPTTYIQNVENAEIIRTHTSGEEILLNKEKLIEQLHLLEQESIDSQTWYHEITYMIDPKDRTEKFPYQLVGILPKWGGGYKNNVSIYIETDGKGILIMTPKTQLYFRAEDSILGGESK